jgi:hypothetical protein
MVIISKIIQKRGGCKCHSPELLHGKITMCWAGRPRNIIIRTEGQGKLREEGDEYNEQISNAEIQRGDIVIWY